MRAASPMKMGSEEMKMREAARKPNRQQAPQLALPSERSPDWIKSKNPDAPAVRREAEGLEA
jgi:hypothetical protein